jgi:hypothetical protein
MSKHTTGSPTPQRSQRRHDVRRRPGFESIPEADRRRERRIRLLERSNEPGHRALAEKLRACRKEARCGSGACPVCMRRARRWFTAAAAELLGGRR